MMVKYTLSMLQDVIAPPAHLYGLALLVVMLFPHLLLVTAWFILSRMIVRFMLSMLQDVIAPPALNTAQYSFLSSPAVANGTIYIGSDNGKMYALNASGCHSTSCSPLWTATTNGIFYSSPAVAYGMVYASSGDDKLYVFNTKTG